MKHPVWYHPHRLLSSFVAMTMAMALVSACAGHVRVTGQLPSPQKMTKIKPGVSSRDDVRTLLGTPSHTPLFTENRWFYIYKKTSSLAFFGENVVDQRTLEFSFDDDGVLQNIYLYSKEQTYDVAAQLRKTPASGRELSFWEQLLSSRASLPNTQPGGP